MSRPPGGGSNLWSLKDEKRRLAPRMLPQNWGGGGQQRKDELTMAEKAASAEVKDAVELFLQSDFAKAARAKQELAAERVKASRELVKIRSERKERIHEARVKVLVSEEGLEKAKKALEEAIGRRGDRLAEMSAVTVEIDRRINELTAFLKTTAPEELQIRQAALRREWDEVANETPEAAGSPERQAQFPRADETYQACVDRKRAILDAIKKEIADIEYRILNP